MKHEGPSCCQKITLLGNDSNRLCKYIECGYCIYKEKCRFVHPSQEGEEKYNLKSGTEIHIKCLNTRTVVSINRSVNIIILVRMHHHNIMIR